METEKSARLLVQLVGVALSSLTLMFGWNWFVSPIGAPTIRFAQALGLGLLSSFILFGSRSEREVNDQKASSPMHLIAREVCTPPLVLLVLWIIHLAGK